MIGYREQLRTQIQQDQRQAYAEDRKERAALKKLLAKYGAVKTIEKAATWIDAFCVEAMVDQAIDEIGESRFVDLLLESKNTEWVRHGCMSYNRRHFRFRRQLELHALVLEHGDSYFCAVYANNVMYMSEDKPFQKKIFERILADDSEDGTMAARYSSKESAYDLRHFGLLRKMKGAAVI